MGPKQEKLFQKSYAHELLRIANGDFESAKALRSAKTGRIENVFFLAHQAVEKALKAVVCWNELPLPFIHDLAVLVALIPNERKFPFGFELAELNDFAAIRRYQEGRDHLAWEDLEKVFILVDQILSWSDKQLKK